MRILVIEDELKINLFIQNQLKEMGHAVDDADMGSKARELFIHHDYDLVILDLMLPDESGLNLCKEFKKAKPIIPIMILTTLGETENKVMGLDAGADDYMTKPFNIDEMSARVRALLRRNSNNGKIILQCGDLILDIVHHQALRGQDIIKLTSKEYSLLEYFMRNIGRPLTRTQIAQHVWDLHFDPGSNVVDVYIKQLRKKIDAPYNKKLIKTIIGLGYSLNEE